jgi:sulfate permease, SulP family
VLQVVRNAGFDRELGEDRLLFNAREAIARYQAMQPLAGGAPAPDKA